MIEQFPELADQGFWYVVPATAQPPKSEGDTRPVVAVNVPPGRSWCAWYDGDQAAVRVADPLAAVAPADRSVAAALDAAWGGDGKPYGRVQGR